MSRAGLTKRWQQLSKWGTLVLGVSALVTSFAWPAKAHAPAIGPTSGSEHGAGLNEVLLRSEGGKLYISERGGPFQELTLGDTPDTAAFRKLLREVAGLDGSVSVPVGSIIVANGGSNTDGNKPKTKHKKKKHTS